MSRLKLRLTQESQVFEHDLAAPVVLARQEISERNNVVTVGEAPGSLIDDPGGRKRLVVGWNPEEDVVASTHATLTPLPNGCVRITRETDRLDLDVETEGQPPRRLHRRGESIELFPPFGIRLGKRWRVYVDLPPSPGGSQSLGARRFPPGAALTHLPSPFPQLDEHQAEQVFRWLSEAASLLQSTVATDDFLERAAGVLVEVVGMHSGRVLLLNEAGSWDPVHVHQAPGSRPTFDPSETVLKEMRQKRETIWLHPTNPAGSLHLLDTVVAAPLLGPDDQVIGALYGEVLRDHPGAAPPGNDRLHATLATILAHTVSAGLARQKVERERTLLEQFFPRALVPELIEKPGLIEQPVKRPVTVLFCDVRGFSTASEKLGAEATFRWISDVLGRLSKCIESEGGVLVDFIGDELMAMWGAPGDQPDHAARAVKAALAMLHVRDELDLEWQQKLGVPTRIGIGINSGEAQVGNVGSATRMKYGPLGDAVNVASRIQGVTKYLKCPLLVSKETWEAAGGEVVGRWVVRAALVGVKQHRDLYELADRTRGQEPFFAESEEALKALASVPPRFSEAVRRSALLLDRFPGDGPLRLTLSRASHALVTDGEGFDFVWQQPSK